MFHQSAQGLVPAELELVRSTELPSSLPPSRIHESREEGKRGHLLEPEQETKQRKNPEARKRNFRRQIFMAIASKRQKPELEEEQKLSGRVHERGWGPGCCHSNVLYRKSPDLSIHLGQHVAWTAYRRVHQALGGEGSLSGHNAYLTEQHQLPSSCFPQQREMNPH